MIHRRPFVQVLARLSLLAATAMYVAVAVVGPFAHESILPTGRTTVAEAPSDPRKGAPAPAHDETHCLVCHSHESVAVPATATSVPLATLRRTPDSVEPASAIPAAVLPRARARAPPQLA